MGASLSRGATGVEIKIPANEIFQEVCGYFGEGYILLKDDFEVLMIQVYVIYPYPIPH